MSSLYKKPKIKVTHIKLNTFLNNSRSQDSFASSLSSDSSGLISASLATGCMGTNGGMTNATNSFTGST